MEIRIGELAERTRCEIVTIRYYEKKGLLLKPARSDGNFRLYGDGHVERLQFIRHCRSLDMTLVEIRALLELRDNPKQDCSEVNALLDGHIQELEARVEALLQLKDHPGRLAREVRRRWPSGCVRHPARVGGLRLPSNFCPRLSSSLIRQSHDRALACFIFRFLKSCLKKSRCNGLTTYGARTAHRSSFRSLGYISFLPLGG